MKDMEFWRWQEAFYRLAELEHGNALDYTKFIIADF